jgi:hypothetical protein
MRVEDEFRHIVESGATQYMLVNVSELREYAMEARMLAEICWSAPTAFARPDAAGRFVDWWSREYFGDAAAGDAARAYRGYYDVLPSWDQISVGANAVLQALTALEARMQRKADSSAAPIDVPALERRSAAYQTLLQTVSAASVKMTPDRQQFFYEHVTLPLLIDLRQSTAAVKLNRALGEASADAARKWCLLAFEDLKTLEDDIRRAERPPFERWYRKTWIRSDDSPYNLHRSYERTLAFLVAHYLAP